MKKETIDAILQPQVDSGDKKTNLTPTEDGVSLSSHKPSSHHDLQEDHFAEHGHKKQHSFHFPKEGPPSFEFLGLKDIDGKVIEHEDNEEESLESGQAELGDSMLHRSVKFTDEDHLGSSMKKLGSSILKSSKRHISKAGESGQKQEQKRDTHGVTFEQLD